MPIKKTTHWINELSRFVGRKPAAETNIYSMAPGDDGKKYQLIWWPSSNHLESELPALIEEVCLKIELAEKVCLPRGVWVIPEGELQVLGINIAVETTDTLKPSELSIQLLEGRTIKFQVNDSRWKYKKATETQRWDNEGGHER